MSDILVEETDLEAILPWREHFRREMDCQIIHDFPEVPADQLRWHGVIEMEGEVAATGGILFHYNPPYGDIFMEVSEALRRRGLGAFLVQALKLVCYEGGYVPAARCSPGNVASRQTLQRASFVPCGHILKGDVQ